MSIAIIGTSVELPDVNGMDSFWHLISSGTSLTRPFPKHRQDLVTEYIRYWRATVLEPIDEADVEYHDGCYLESVGEFDHTAFGMSPRQAALTDPQHRMATRAMFLALEDAGYGTDRLRGSRTGVFVRFATNPGSTYLDYLSRIDPSLGQQALTGNIPTMMANRISHMLDLKGPSLVVDSACSATLVALHQARNAILAGDCDMAVVAGARLVQSPVKHPLSAIGIESSDGVTRTFDEDADGTGFGEGSGAVVLKRLDRAIADGDRIYAKILGSAVTHDGKTEGITTPSAAAQAELLQSAWASAGIDPRTIGYLEAHGTATEVGDPIENAGMRAAFAQHTTDQHFCAVGTVKANVGHLFEGSGVIGILKAVSVLQHQQIPPQANFVTANPRLAFDTGPLYVPTELKPWTSEGSPRRAGVSAFGLGGTNAHVVLEEYTPEESSPSPDGHHVFVLSAATRRSLSALVDAYIIFIDDGHLEGVDVADVCWTAQMSRSSHAHRVVLVVRDLDELRSGLVRTRYSGQVELGRSAEGQTASRYLAGETIDWTALSTGASARRIVQLPQYAFDNAPAWVEFPDDWRSSSSLGEPPTQHTLTHDVELRPAERSSDTALTGPMLALVDPTTTAGSVVELAFPEARILHLGEPLVEGGTPFAVDDPSLLAELVDHLESAGIERLVYGLAFETHPADTIAEVDRRSKKNLYGLFQLAKALIAGGAKLDLTVLSHRAVAAEEGEAAVVENATLVGFGKVIAREYPYVHLKHIDVDEHVHPSHLRAEVLSAERGLSVLRGDARLREVFVEVANTIRDQDPTAARPYLRAGGTYLVTGGTGALGLAVAHDLAQAQPDATLILASRSGLPARETWDEILASASDERIARTLRQVSRIEALGATVIGLSVDVGDTDAWSIAIQGLLRDHHRIDGVVHAAGLPGGSTIMFRESSDVADVVRAKVHAAWVLERELRDSPPDFIAHFSSVAAVFPAPGQADYAAANYVLDNLARARAGGPTHVTALDWVAWKEIGMAVDFGTNGDTIFRAIPTSDGLAVLDLALRSGRSRLFGGELNYRGELIDMLRSYDVALSSEIDSTVRLHMLALDERRAKAAGKIRSAVSAVQVEAVGRDDAPCTATELKVAQCLALSLGYQTIDVDEDFFTLGGDSLMATGVAANIAAVLGVPYDSADLLADRTISEIGYHVDELLDGVEQAGEIR